VKEGEKDTAGTWMVDEKRKQKVVVETKWYGMEDGGNNVEHETKGKK
jgi:hypothetical protein